jgi:hypothetical protein
MRLVGTCLEANGVDYALHPVAYCHASRYPKLRSPPLAALHPADEDAEMLPIFRLLTFLGEAPRAARRV